MAWVLKENGKVVTICSCKMVAGVGQEVFECDKSFLKEEFKWITEEGGVLSIDNAKKAAALTVKTKKETIKTKGKEILDQMAKDALGL